MTDTAADSPTTPRTAGGLGWPMADGVPSGGLGWPTSTIDPAAAGEESA